MARAWRSTILPVSWLWTSMVFSSRWWGWFHNTILEEDHVGLSCYGSYAYVRAYGAVPPLHAVGVIEGMHPIDADQQDMADSVALVDVLRVGVWGHEEGESHGERGDVALGAHSVSPRVSRIAWAKVSRDACGAVAGVGLEHHSMLRGSGPMAIAQF